MAEAVQLASAGDFDKHTLSSEAFKRIDTTIINDSLLWASGIALGFVQKRKTLPLKSWGSDLRHAVCRIAAYDLMSKRGFAPGSGSNQEIRNRYDDAMAWLRDVAKGLAELVDCVDSSSTPEIDEAGPLAASDPIVNWNYQTRGGPFSRSGGGYGCGGNGL